MKWSQLFLILSGVYIAPALPTGACIIFGAVYLIISIIAARMGE